MATTVISVDETDDGSNSDEIENGSGDDMGDDSE